MSEQQQETYKDLSISIMPDDFKKVFEKFGTITEWQASYDVGTEEQEYDDCGYSFSFEVNGHYIRIKHAFRGCNECDHVGHCADLEESIELELEDQGYDHRVQNLDYSTAMANIKRILTTEDSWGIHTQKNAFTSIIVHADRCSICGNVSLRTFPVDWVDYDGPHLMINYDGSLPEGWQWIPKSTVFDAELVCNECAKNDRVEVSALWRQLQRISKSIEEAPEGPRGALIVYRDQLQEEIERLDREWADNHEDDQK